MELQCWHVMRCAPELELHDRFSHIATCNASCIVANEEATPDVAPESCLKIPLQPGIECSIAGVVFFHLVGTNGNAHTLKVWHSVAALEPLCNICVQPA